MPVAAPWPCRQSGCKQLVTDKTGFCPEHRRESYRRQKQNVSIDYKERNRFYQRKPWKLARAERLSIEPLCRSCRAVSKLVAATVVDHIIAIEDGGAELDQDNLQSLCIDCHNSKTARGWVKTPQP